MQNSYNNDNLFFLFGQLICLNFTFGLSKFRKITKNQGLLKKINCNRIEKYEDYKKKSSKTDNLQRNGKNFNQQRK